MFHIYYKKLNIVKNFLTRVDLSDDRQIKQNENTLTTFSGSISTLQYTTLGLDYNSLKKGVDLTTSGYSGTDFVPVLFNFTGTTGSTTYFSLATIFSSIVPNLPIITNDNYLSTFTSSYFDPIQSATTDGNIFAISFSGVEINFDVFDFGFIGSITGGTFSGNCSANYAISLSAITYPWWYLKNGSTTWLTVSGRTHTQKLSVESVGVPTSSASSGITGTITWDTNNIYVCVGPNSWKKASLSTF